MTQQRPDRGIPRNYFLYFIQAVEEEIGNYSLDLMFEIAGLVEWRPRDEPIIPLEHVKASDMAKLQRSLREYYGSGARGILKRAGRGTWGKMVENLTGPQKATLMLIKKLPLYVRRVRILDFLAESLGAESGQSFVYPMDPNLIFVDHFSDTTFGQESEETICWFTVGMIQSCLYWITDIDHVVEEISCLARGDKACRFEIRQ